MMMCNRFLNHCAIRYRDPLRHNNDTISNKKVRSVHLLRLARRPDNNPFANSHVFIDNRILNHALRSNSNIRTTTPNILRLLCWSFKKVSPHQN